MIVIFDTTCIDERWRNKPRTWSNGEKQMSCSSSRRSQSHRSHRISRDVYEEIDLQANGYSIPNFIEEPQLSPNRGYLELRGPSEDPDTLYSRRLPSLAVPGQDSYSTADPPQTYTRRLPDYDTDVWRYNYREYRLTPRLRFVSRC